MTASADSDKNPNELSNEQWVVAGEYSIALIDGQIHARNSRGTQLKSIPSKLKKEPEYERLEAVTKLIEQHKSECKDNVYRWFLTQSEVPTAVIQAVWEDEAWRETLIDLVVTDGVNTGLLRNAGSRGLGLVDIDGESLVSEAESIKIPHPVSLADIEEWRGFIAEMGSVQHIDQVFREIHLKPTSEKQLADAVHAYEGVKYKTGGQLMGRARGAGFKSSISEIQIDVSVGQDIVSAVLDVSIDYFDSPAELGTLGFLTAEDQPIPLPDVDPIAWSEGIRMCQFIYAGREINEKSEGK